MNIAYYYEFKGLDKVLNRVEILTADSVAAKEITGTGTPFVLNYTDVKKLEPIQGAGATIGIVSHELFEFVPLHTDDMQKYMVRMYRNGSLYWLGWLDPELYDEQLSDYPPYPVEFTAADFNVMERLKYRDASENRYTDVATMITHLKRCFDKLGLPFQKLYIGCTTTANGITLSASETPLHALYVMSANFYDEDGEPMTCREVVESILQPFGLMMVQKDANIYIYDYNTVANGLPMKRYDFASWSYEAEETPVFNIGDLKTIGFMSTSGQYGFEEMYNNVTITSSLYADSVQMDAEIDEETASDPFRPQIPQLNTFYYRSSDAIENLKSDGFFVIFNERNLSSYVGETNSVSGCYVYYTPDALPVEPLFRVRYPNYITKVESEERKPPFYINLKVEAYPSTTSQPLLQQKAENVANSGVLKAFCNLYCTDETGKVTAYYDNTSDRERGWKTVANVESIEQGKCVLWFSTDNTDNSILDTWTTNGNKVNPMDKPDISTVGLDSSLVGQGLYCPPEVSGFLVFEITNKNILLNPVSENRVDENKIIMILFNSISIRVTDTEGNTSSTDDYEFKSYVNKKVKSDFEDITLKCISANEEKAPIGKANIMKKTDNNYDFQLSYTRSGQTDILERLLMCTIHSNYTQKNEQFGCTVKLKGNPVMGYVSYQSVLDGSYWVSGAEIDFRRATMSLSCVGYSPDTAKLSSIPYE